MQEGCIGGGGENHGRGAGVEESQVVGAQVVAAAGGGDVVVVGEGSQIAALDMERRIEVKGEEKSGVKKKRGRPARVQLGRATQPNAQVIKVNDEEDVCFICFDGGSLVLCDRRGCPKAYHPACIKRDEAFFQSKSKWNCGWHLCSNCEKASYFMCYTCTYSLCKGCTKDADILCVRGSKGFCTTCMKTIMLLENSEQGNKDSIQVDFDDKSSWEYLFKVYWIYTKTKLSLTFGELTKVKNPGKGAVLAQKSKFPDKPFDSNEDKDYNSDSFSDYQEGEDHRKKKAKKLAKLLIKEDSNKMTKTNNATLSCMPNGEEWASKELLEFVAHMNNGDISVLSQFDVQALLLEYVKINNLRDPRRKSEIICDSRLLTMFGRARVSHFEMLKLLELHFLNREDSQINSIIQGGFIGPVATGFEVDDTIDKQMMMVQDKKHKTRKMGVDRGVQTNLDEYAAIDFHNISLIYLRRSLIESLLEDREKFHAKVVGTVVRIRLSNSDQPQDYRLVRVVGTSKVPIPYKVGQRTVDVMIEILNLDKKEAISIDEISNQEFSKDECIWLRQSIKRGTVKRFTIGDILGKAVALQAVRVNDWLEAEILRLNHLRDRASENGHTKDLRECLEKLQLLNTPEERQRRELEIPEVHADPRMDPSYESEDLVESDHRKQDDNLEPRSSNFSKISKKPSTKYGTCKTVKSISGRKKSVTSSEGNRSISTSGYLDRESATRTSERDIAEPIVYPQNDAYRPNLTEVWNMNQAVQSHESSGMDNTDNSEIEKVWNYRDPAGTIQGPFPMMQLRKWSTIGYFPPDLKIWRTNNSEDDSLFLTDAMNGYIPKESQTKHTSNDLTVKSTANTNFTPADISEVTPAERPFQDWDSINGKEPELDQSQKHSSLLSPNSSGKVFAAVSRQGGEEEDHQYSENDSGKAGIQELKPQASPVDSSTNTLEIASTLVSITKSFKLLEQNHEVNLPNSTNPTPKPSDEKKNSASSTDYVQVSSPNCSNNASILAGGEAQPPLVANEWGGYSPTPTKPSVDDWDLNLVSDSSLKQNELSRDLVSNQNSKIDELFNSPSLPVSTTTDWQALLDGSDDFQLVDEWVPKESVSDLLAEVDAMESLNNGTPSPTSAIDCNADLLSPASYTGKSDAMSCSSNILMPCQSTGPNGSNEPLQKSSGGQSLTNNEAEGETQPLDSSSASWELPGVADGDWRGGPEIVDTGRGQVQSNPALNWGGPVQININMGWGNGQGNPPQANTNINWVNPVGTLGAWPNQPPQYGSVERFSSQRVDRNSFQGGVSSYGRDNRSWNRAAPSFGGGGSSFRPSPKGRICKFYESGRCKKGAFCDYLHP